jgi:hypothetical protein
MADTTGIWLFAECHILCRVFFRALGKQALCRVSRKKPSVKENTRRISSLPSVLFLTLRKEFLCRVSFFDTRQRALYIEIYILKKFIINSNEKVFNYKFV